MTNNQGITKPKTAKSSMFDGFSAGYWSLGLGDLNLL
jgi:hypothetical protein